MEGVLIFQELTISEVLKAELNFQLGFFMLPTLDLPYSVIMVVYIDSVEMYYNLLG